jgi:hypothetical protein
MTGRIFFTLLVFAALTGVSCSDKSTPLTEPSPAPLDLDLMPLAQGTIWTYSFYMMESFKRETLNGLRMTNQRTYGTMELNVASEMPGGFTRSWLLKSEFNVDSVRIEDFLDYQLLSLSGTDNPNTYTEEISIFYERDTLWYSEDGVLDYMMPGTFMPGGTVNLKLFNWPGTDYFQQPLPFSAEWASGDKVYLRQNQKIKTAVKIGDGEGVVGVWAASEGESVVNSRDRVDRELYFSLISVKSPNLASDSE